MEITPITNIEQLANILGNDATIFPGKKLRGKSRYAKLYHYTSFDSFVKIWLTQKLKFGNINSVNDIKEANFSVSVNNHQQIPLLYASKEIKNSYKQISFTMDYDTFFKGCMSPMMWGLYATKATGVCIEFDFEKLKFPKDCIKGIVKYEKVIHHTFDLPTNLTTISDVEKFMLKHKQKIFFTKEFCWAGENEYRILSKEDFLDISNAISTVYLTSCDSLECILTENLVNGTVPVKYIHYHSTGKSNLSLPILSDTSKERAKIELSKNNPRSFQNRMHQAEEFYQQNKSDRNLSLLKEIYKD